MGKDKKLTYEERNVNTEISEEMKKAYLDYAMSVIVSRAIPSVEDGLKPVQRRILYSMKQMNLKPTGQTKKSARIVGDVIGKYHPHGDTAVYDTMVRMAQDFSMRYPLVFGQGNFGSVDGDSPAAYRYTEAKTMKLTSEMLQDLERETVKFIPNFDNTLKEPTLLPGKVPNLMINGATGIAVGMSTNIPPHNLSEICDAIVAQIKNPEIELEELTEIVQGPDFPTGGYLSGDIDDMYKTGKGKLLVRGKTSKKKVKNRESVESSQKGIRIVLELKKRGNPKFVINTLYKYTRLQTSFPANFLALVKGQPKVLGLKEILNLYIEYRKKIIKKRSEFELKKAKERQEIVEGLLIALKNIDNVIKNIKVSKSTTEALETLKKNYKLSEKQAKAVLETKLQQLTSMEKGKLEKESKELKQTIDKLNKILGDVNEILKIIKEEVKELKKNYGDARKTRVLKKIKKIKEKDLIQKKDVVISITEKGYCKRMDLQKYRNQNRGGVGVKGNNLATGDFTKQIITCSTTEQLLFFTSRGRVLWLKAYKIPEIERYAKGKAIVNLLDLRNERITRVMSVKDFNGDLIMATKLGKIKRISLENFSKPRSSGIIAIKLPLDNSDSLVGVEYLEDGKETLLATKNGKAIRFETKEIRRMGRSSYGVRGIKLDKGDEVVSLEVIKTKEMMTITEKGYGKRTAIESYRKTSRGGKGVINLKVSEKTGKVVNVIPVNPEDGIIISTAKGMTIRTNLKNIRVMGRAAKGVKVVRLQQGDRVIDLVRIENGEESE